MIFPFWGVLFREIAGVNALGENNICYNVGFKSYEITKTYKLEASVTFRVEKEKTEVGAFEPVGNQKQRLILIKGSTLGETSHVGAVERKKNSN